MTPTFLRRSIAGCLIVAVLVLLTSPADLSAQSSSPSGSGQKASRLDGPKAMGSGEKALEEGAPKKAKLWPYLLAGAAVIGIVVAVILLTKKKTGGIQVNSAPAGAKIFLDGADTGKTTNATLTGISPGNHALKLVLADYLDYGLSVSVSAGKTARVDASLTPVPATTGTIQVDSTPTGARIFLDGADTGRTTNAALADVGPGDHALRLTLADYNDYQQTVNVQAGQTTQVSASLVPLTETTGIIQVNSTPTGAKIYLNNVDTNKTTNAALTLLAPGLYTVALTLSGYRDFSQNVTVTAAQTVTVNATLTATGVLEPEMVYIPGGTFQMGSDSAESDSIERPVHQVTVSGFWMGKYEVTQAEFMSVMGMNPSAFRDNVRNPVEQVEWADAQTYIQQLNAATGRNYRLPTEAEWEYAARAGTTGDRYGDLNSVAWWENNSGNVPHPVGGKLPNAFGLYDMLGNLWEWCSDWFGPYSAAAQTDPQGPTTGVNKTLRGGSWLEPSSEVRTPNRYTRGQGLPPISWGDDLGFRVVRQ